MVFTRSKKKYSEDPDEENLKVNEDFSNVNIHVIKKKRPNKCQILDSTEESESISETLDLTESEDEKVTGDEYEKFMKYVDKIYRGDFFFRVPIEDKIAKLKKEVSFDKIKELNSKLSQFQTEYKNEAPSVVDVLKMNVDESLKKKLLEKIYTFSNSDILSGEYSSNLKYLLTNINKSSDPELFELEKKIIKTAQSEEFSDDYRRKILLSKMSFENKVIAYKRLEVMERYEDSDNSEYAKYKNWMDLLLAVPFGNLIPIPNESSDKWMTQVRGTLDSRLSFLEKPKDQVINVVAQMIRNPDINFNAIGLYGNKGLGKTSICKSIADALGRPFRAISLGGESDSSLLTGHGFTYVGSNPGRLIEMLIETKSMNPVILLDELDKVSQTNQGKEIIGTLIHLTDTTTNAKYNYDRYFAGIEFDLSKVLFVFTYNDPSKVDRILADRLFKIKVENYSFSEKLEITNKHLIKGILEEFRFSNQDIDFSEETIRYIVSTSKSDEGMRDVKRKFEIIISRINTLLLTQNSNDIVRLKYKTLGSYYKSLPVTVQKEHVDILLENSIDNDTIDSGPPPGMYI